MATAATPVPGPQSETIRNHAAFIWSVADLLRGDYKQSEYGKVILPLTVIRRLDCVLEPTKQAVLAKHKQLSGRIENVETPLQIVAGQQFYNTSPLTFTKLLDAPDTIADALNLYIGGFSEAAKDVIDKFDFGAQIDRLRRANLLYRVLGRFAEIDLHPDVVSNIEMGYLYEELIRRFSELSNETAGEHFTPREVIRLMVNLLFIEDEEALIKPGIVRKLYDPACGTGGMLSVAEDHLRALNPQARLEVFGQELNAETYAVCRSDMMLKGQDASRIAYGNSFAEDRHEGERFDYLLANPPFGVEWKKVEHEVRDEAAKRGFAGRFGAGLPRINDGSFLFLQHMISKMKPVQEGGSRVAIVFNGSPLFTGATGSGESEIRRWIIENDWLEAVVALPDQLFYNTGISTYFWIVTNRKAPERRGKVQLVDARELFVKMRKSLGEKRKQISEEQIAQITRLYGEFAEGEKVKIFPNEAFGFMRITVERPLRLRWEISEETIAAALAAKAIGKLEADTQTALRELLEDERGARFATQSELVETFKDAVGVLELPAAAQKALWSALAIRDEEAPVITNRKGEPEPDPELRDNENVPLPPVPVSFVEDPAERFATLEYRTAVDDYMRDEVLPYVPDAWVDYARTDIGYEIPLTRQFFQYVPARPLEEVDAEIKALEDEIQRLLADLTARRYVAKQAVAGRLTSGSRARKETRIPWLTDIPAHWREANLKLVARLGSGHTPSRSRPEWWVDPTIPWVTTGEVVQMRSDHIEYITETRERISELGLLNSSAVLHPAGTVVLSRTASVGYSAIMACPMATSQDFVTWTCGPLLRPRFLLLCLRAMRQDLLGRLAMGSTHKTIYLPDIESIKIPLPRLDEQDELVDAAWSQQRVLDVCATRLRSQLDLIQERRQALITAAVTGQLDIPEAA